MPVESEFAREGDWIPSSERGVDDCVGMFELAADSALPLKSITVGTFGLLACPRSECFVDWIVVFGAASRVTVLGTFGASFDFSASQ